MYDHHVYYYYLFLIITVARNQREKKRFHFSGLLMGIAIMDSDSPQYIG